MPTIISTICAKNDLDNLKRFHHFKVLAIYHLSELYYLFTITVGHWKVYNYKRLKIVRFGGYFNTRKHTQTTRV